MCRQRICFILHITAVLPSPVQCCEWEMFPQILHLPALPHCASFFPHSMSFGWGFIPCGSKWPWLPRGLTTLGFVADYWCDSCVQKSFKGHSELYLICLLKLHGVFEVSSREIGNNFNSSRLLILWNMRVWSTFLSRLPLHLSEVSALHSDCCSLAHACSLHEALGSSQLTESDEQSHYCFCDDSFFTHFLGRSCFKITPVLKVILKSALWHRLPFFASKNGKFEY